jgi:hypothetical protein
MDIENLEKIAETHFLNLNFVDAVKYFNMALQLNSKDKDLKIKMIISDMALESPNEAIALYDYYTILKQESPKNYQETIMQLIDNSDKQISMQVDELNSIFGNLTQKSSVPENSISYKEFLDLVELRGDFKMAFEDIIFSQRVIAIEEDDFSSFIKILIDNNLNDVALRYIENLKNSFKYDKNILKLFNKQKGNL